MTKSREIHLVRRPEGMPTVDEFELVERDIPDAGDGQILVQNLYMSVDPAMRPRLSVGQPLNEPMGGGALGRVVASKAPGFAVGDLVSNRSGFREYFLSDGRGVSKLEAAEGIPVTAYMSVLGNPGFTAYGGLLHIGQLREGEQVFVSTAAGAVGQVAVQIAKIRNCYVIGSTGSDDKVRWLKDVAGIDAAINYKTDPIRKSLREAAPKGVDVYFDNVGGEHLDAALAVMNPLGRVAVCGMISGYNERGSRAPVYNLSNIIYGRMNLRGFVATDFMHLYDEFRADMVAWLRDGRMQYQETIMEGIANAPAALVGLMQGANAGKMLVKLAD